MMEQFTTATLKTGLNTEKAIFGGQMGLIIKEKFLIQAWKDMEYTIGQLKETGIKASEKTIK